MITETKKSTPDGEHFRWGNNCEGWHLFKSDSLDVIRERMPSSTSEIMHYHEHAQQVFYILSGAATFEMDGKTCTISVNENIHVPQKKLHRISNNSAEDLYFLLVSQPKTQGDRVEIIDYDETLNEPIKLLNYEWLEKYFRVEPSDIVQLSNPKKEIIDQGGAIFYARWNHEIVGTASLLRITPDEYELGKMAVTEKARGHYIGNALIEHCFHVSERMKIRKLILYSNTSLKPAIHLYRKYGFREVQLESHHYERANIKMEKYFNE
jgi:mannose-6-phosphate isomerase-like protein (cupin superfamily)/N-acetylglutamate synthase-like GNAT family acetyltransferase